MPTINEFGFDAPMLANLGVVPGSRGYQVFVVDPYNGADGQPGTFQEPMASLVTALGRCQEGRGDTVLLMGGPRVEGATSMTMRLAANLDWNKDYTHLVGMCAPTYYGQRSRITGPAAGGSFSPVLTVSSMGGIFKNFSVFDDYTVDPVALKYTGSRCYFENVGLQGMGAATGADDAAGASLWCNGGNEAEFNRCTIGLDTIPRSTTNGEILFDAAAKRIKFRDCHIKSYSDNAGHLFVKATGSGDIDREINFINCLFENAPTGVASGTTQTQAMSVHASAGGGIYLHNCTIIGATDVAAADNANVFVGPGIAAVGTAGLAVAVTR